MPTKAREILERREEARTEGTSTLPGEGRIQQRVEAAKERINEARKEQMKEFVRKTIARMRAAIERLTKIADRIESRISKIEQLQNARANASTTSSGGGVGKVNVQDISFMKNSLTVARTQIEKAKAALAEAEAGFSSYVPPSTEATLSATGTPIRPQPGMGQTSPMRESLKKAEAAIRAAHKALTEAVGSMGRSTSDDRNSQEASMMPSNGASSAE
jgi:cellobiose-specific phosphotransferase system component IIA